MKLQTDRIQSSFIRSSFFLKLVRMVTGCTQTQAKEYRPLFRTMIQNTTGAGLQAFLYVCLSCDDLTQQDRAEIRTMLRQADTFLTDQQAEKIKQLF